jgi:hypothetical protein
MNSRFTVLLAVASSVATVAATAVAVTHSRSDNQPPPAAIEEQDKRHLQPSCVYWARQ